MSVNLKECLGESDLGEKIGIMANAEQYLHTTLLLNAVKQRLEKENKKMLQDAKFSDIFKEDVRYWCGFAAALEWLLEIPAECKKQVRLVELPGKQ